MCGTRRTVTCCSIDDGRLFAHLQSEIVGFDGHDAKYIAAPAVQGLTSRTGQLEGTLLSIRIRGTVRQSIVICMVGIETQFFAARQGRGTAQVSSHCVFFQR